MRPGTLFWGSILILIGGFLLLSNLGVLRIDFWQIFWPSLLILLGIWFLLGAFSRRSIQMEHDSIPLEGASRARLHLKHGAGRLNLFAGAGEGKLLEGDFGGGIEAVTRRDGDTLHVTLKPRPQFWSPFSWGPGSTLDWSFGIIRDLPLELVLDTGASDSRIDLTELRVMDLRLSSGASSTELSMPTNAGNTRARISTGAASLRVRIPSGVAASIRASGGLASITVDKARFPKQGSVYQSPDYDTASNRADLDIETGVGSVDIH
jgi:hypothetical protein